MLSGAAMVTRALIISIALTTNFYLVVLIHLAADVASAAMMILSSIMCSIAIIGELFLGFMQGGVGILPGNECVIIGLSKALDTTNIWFRAGLMPFILLLLLFILFPRSIGQS